jgi:hypothetical protein
MIMMRIKNIKLLIMLAGMTCALLSCDKDYDRVFNESPDERVQRSLDEFRAMLLAAPYGWKASLVTQAGIEYFYYLDFNEDGQVRMLSDFNETTAGTVQSSAWKLKALQTTTLSFPTYSYIHLPADPDGDVNGGGDGEGRKSDFEFAFARASGDSILLEGIQRGSAITFVKATEQEQALVLNGRVKDILTYGVKSDGLRLVLPDDHSITFSLNAGTKYLSAQYISDDGERVEVFKTPYVISMEGIVLSKPIRTKGYTVQELLWDADHERYYVQSGATNLEVLEDKGLFFFKPSVPVQQVLGNDYLALYLRQGTDAAPLKGQSDDFITLYKAAAESMLNGEYGLTMHDMYFIFDVATNKMYFGVYVVQNNNLYLCLYTFDYTVSSEGVYKFNYKSQDDNGSAIRGDMQSILDYIGNDTFKAEFVGGTFELTGGMFSQENPGFSFSGYLVN